MGISRLSDSNLISQRCVVYCEMGKERELAILFGIMGITNEEKAAITQEDIREHAEAVVELWGIKQKSACHVCDKAQTEGRLCACFYETLITPINLAEYYAKLPPTGVALRYICATCKKETSVPVGVVKSAFAEGKYRMPFLCRPCHKAITNSASDRRSPKQRFQPPKLGDSNVKLAALQAEAAQSSTITPEG